MADKSIKSINLLPEFFRTEKNSKFLSSTIDQLIQPPKLERLDGYVGSKLTPTYSAIKDTFIPETSSLRRNYQLEPALTVKDSLGSVNDVIGIDDLTNEIARWGGSVANFDKIYRTDFFAFDPHIDWDKFVNYQEYYWLVNGPDTVTITGTQLNSTSTFLVRDNVDGSSYIFTPDGLSEDPIITLYRGNTYTFDVNSDFKFFIKTSPSIGSGDQYNVGVTNNGTSNGQITIVIDNNTPSSLFYCSDDQQNTQGRFVVKTITEDSRINVELEVLGKKNYTSGTGVNLSNGMKIRFGGTVIPESYANKEFYVEGVGSEIKLVNAALLVSAEAMSETPNENFDGTNFDDFPFDNFKTLPLTPEYITINRASVDLNPWSRYNRWVHKNVIEVSALANGQERAVLPIDKRASRPIVEFKANLKLYNFGSYSDGDVDFIDTVTTDAFSNIEGSAYYHVDQIKLDQGNLVIFAADEDDNVRNKIFEVNYLLLDGQTRIELKEIKTIEAESSVYITNGKNYKGTSWWFDGDKWKFGQQKEKLNQAPLFDLFDNKGVSYNSNIYNSNFSGTKIFSYEVGQGTPDPVLGFPLKYKNSSGVGSFTFKNYFATEFFTIPTENNDVTTVPTALTFLRFSDRRGHSFKNIWNKVDSYPIPILEFKEVLEATKQLELKSIDKPEQTSFDLDVFVDNNKITSASFTKTFVGGKCFINFSNELSVGTNVLFKIYTDATPNDNGYYEPPIGLTNNPLNGPIEILTLSEISDHVESMVNRVSEFQGTFPGSSNIRDIDNISKYGSRLVANLNSLSFAQMFIGKLDHNVLTALTKAGDQYNQFKLTFLKKLQTVDDQLSPSAALDRILNEINVDKDILSSWYSSDMLGYGPDKKIRTWTVANIKNKIYPFGNDFTLQSLSLKSVLVYLNGTQLLHGYDYSFIDNDSSIEILISLTKGDVITVVDYNSTEGCYVPATPTKLGMYPKFKPSKFLDTSYIEPVYVIQGHDGSIMAAYNDYRDDIVLEYEKRIYNNIKVEFKQDLIDLNSVLPGAFRNNRFSWQEVNNILSKDFVKWAGFYGVEPYANEYFDQGNSFTYNYTGSYVQSLNKNLNGSWRAVFRYFYDTDKPHLSPWEMLGFSEEPSWWEEEYGAAPYTSNNEILWQDIENGIIRQGSRQGIDSIYQRPGLADLLPVDEDGNLVNPQQLVTNLTIANIQKNWKFGDVGPAELAWRRSSYWPFAVQKLLALTQPASYCTFMYDPSRLEKNIAGQWTYGDNKEFPTLKTLSVSDDENLTSGYSVYISEIGRQRSQKYLEQLKSDLVYADYNLFYKVGGFVSKDKLQIIIDAIDPVSTSPGALLPPEDYQLILNVSNPVKSSRISGIIVQKSNGKFVVKGYDTANPYFSVYEPIRTANTPTITVGGISESFVVWQPSSTTDTSNVDAINYTSAASSANGSFYKAGQIVSYKNQYYRVKISHKGSSTFNEDYFVSMPYLPIKGGATVQQAADFNKSIKQIPYGTEFQTTQEVYDVIIGYGAWLEDQGFIFDNYNSDLNEVLDWEFSGKEFLYWTTQNWANNSIITLSPFADQIKFKFADTVVDNIFNSFYDYSILQSNGIAFPRQNLFVNRQDGLCTIDVTDNSDGIYFAVLNSVQKEHGIVFNNKTMFNDTIYDIETGYRQRRVKLVGFRTKDWDGDFFSPGFVYDTAAINDWKAYTDYRYGDVVRFASKYYSAKANVAGADKFDFTKWVLLGNKPVASLLPNFDYKIGQFEDFYSLDIDNFDAAQQKMAQHLIGYTPRVYLNNIFTNPIAQYKFYQGFIKEKGTKNAVKKLAKASIHNLQGELDFTEEWAFRVGTFGSYSSYQEIEVPLKEGQFIENPQVVKFTDDIIDVSEDLIYYSTSSDLLLSSEDYIASNTFITTSSSDVIKLETAGFVRLDEVELTAFNEDTILDIADNRQLKDGDVIWLGNKNNGDWDVLRYTLDSARVLRAFTDPANVGRMTFVTKGVHGLKEGELVSVSQFDDTLDGIYRVSRVPTLTQFEIEFESVTFVSGASPTESGLLYKFISVKFKSFDAIVRDSEILKLPLDTRIWVTNETSDKPWQVFKKIDNYKEISIKSSLTPENQKYGYTVTKKKSDGLFLVGAPGFSVGADTGSVFAYKEVDDSVQFQFKFNLNPSPTKTFLTTGYETDFGVALEYDDIDFNSTNYGLVFSGAPAASFVKYTTASSMTNLATTTGVASVLTEQGLVKISSIDPVLVEENTEIVFVSPEPSNYERFGSSIWQNNNLLLVGAPGNSTTGNGSVYAYNYSTTSSTVNLSYLYKLIDTTVTLTTGSRYGQVISGADLGNKIAVSAPGYNQNTGLVSIFDYNGTSTTWVQTIQSPFGIRSKFGEDVKISAAGDYLFVSAPEARSLDQAYGKVAVYKKNINTFELLQTLDNPVPRVGMKFGQSIDVNPDATEIVIGAVGLNKRISTTFNKYSLLLEGEEYLTDVNSELSDEETTFDGGSTKFFDEIKFSGAAYVYNRNDDLFRLAAELQPLDLSTGTNFGHSVSMNDNSIYIGAPAYKTKLNENLPRGAFHQFYKKDVSSKSWQKIREQDSFVDIDTIQKVVLIDSFKDEIVDYLDVIDPVKGKIAGVAEQDLTWKTAVDPAVYTVGNDSTVIDTDTNWLDEHVGELWWDLSTARYIVYEQGDLVYRKNNWGKLFPGATIDVYEWISSDLLPNEWAALADTPEGLTRNISGQPKHADNTVLSVKQIYNPINNSFTNQYYYWVKNKVIVPSVKNRRISSRQVASIIENPTQYGLKYAAVIDSNAVALANVGNLLVGDRINVNIAMDTLKSSIPRHTEWLLLQQGSANSMPSSLLEKKLLDSLLGRDSLGNLVPDPALSYRERYGISIRPRQTMFKDRLSALRNIIEFSNDVLKKQQITGNFSFKNLNLQEEIPNIVDREYDVVVEDNEGLNFIDTRGFETAKISCSVDNGRIISVTIEEPGSGYRIPPKITIVNNLGAELKTEIDSNGSVTSVVIENSGNGFADDPQLLVRPFTAIVLTDSESGGKWAKFQYDTVFNSWIRVQTQKFNTRLYWDYIDWQSDSYNKYRDYSFAVDQIYQLDSLEDVLPGQYVKINNNGLGNFIVLEKVSTGTGNFTKDYNIVFSEKGTIQINNLLWNRKQSNLNYDQRLGFDQTLFDQTPDIELSNILQALKNDLFINELKVNWNLLFFTAVKYALGEQKLLDWAFKTSFINVTNYAGSLEQRPIYKLQNSSYYEDYLKEVKPYHTKIRNYTTNYSILEPSGTAVSDFDLPAYYDKEANRYRAIEITADTPKSVFTLTETNTNLFPWKSWADNYTFGISSISVNNPGVGYTVTPTVEIIPQVGDLGFGAEAKAYIRSGEVFEIEVTAPGSGYIKPPIIQISGGGPNVTVKATAYANLYNGKVRSTKVGMKFDRISSKELIDEVSAYDTFICDGSRKEFKLNWLAFPEKLFFTVKLDGTLVLGSDYTVEFFDETDSLDYTAKSCKLVFLNDIPKDGQILEVSYTKNINLLHAVDRINNYYSPESGMPGKEPSQLMYGIEYPRTKIEALSFEYTTKWGIQRKYKDNFGNEYTTSSYGITAWADDIGTYVVTTATSNSSALGVTATYITVNSVEGIAKGHFVNVISTTTNAFTTTSTVRVIDINTASKTVLVDRGVVSTLKTGTEIEFWNYSNDLTILDSAIDGGSLNTSTKLASLGLNPEDIIISGDGFLTPNTIYGPEELVPGEVNESLGINVFTKNPEGAPIVVSSYFNIPAGTTSTQRLRIVPPNYASINVTFNNTILSYNSTTNFIGTNEYSIDWETNDIIVPAQNEKGKVSYTIVSIGGGRDSVEAGVIDSSSITTNQVDSVQIVSLSKFDTVKSAYVTVNGVKTNNYTLGTANAGSNRAAVNVYGLTTGTTATVTAWFFGTAFKYYNEIVEQVEDIIVSTSNTQFITLDQPPGIIQPASAQILVELTDNVGTRFLRPPHVDYYQVTNALNKTYRINNDGFYDNNRARVFVNGVELRKGFDFSVNQYGPEDYRVTISITLRLNDVIAISSLPDTSYVDYDFDVIDNTLKLLPFSSGEGTPASLRIISYTNHDDMLMRTERFDGTPIRRYKISRPVLDENYVWVIVNGVALINKHDYEILDDMVTVQISDAFEHSESDSIVITSISSAKLASTVLGYRIFQDVLNRTHYKRFSKQNTTHLTKELHFTDTEIHVADASVLTVPNVEKNLPGVVLIDGERIEFFKIEGNILKQLRRSTLGTAPALYSEVMSKVMDQGLEQTVPYKDIVKIQHFLTTSTQQDYIINKNNAVIDLELSGHRDYIAGQYVAHKFYNDGITLSTATNTNAVDTISVFYGGRPLRKTGIFYQDTKLSYDSPNADLINLQLVTTSTAETLLETEVIGKAYLETSTNKIWVYEDSLSQEAINGYTYRGLRYSPPEFTVNTATQQLTLNIEDGIKDGVLLTVVKKEFARNNVWNNEITTSTTLSLMESTTTQAKFLQAKPAELPDKYFYGGDPSLIDLSGFALTDENDKPLEEY